MSTNTSALNATLKKIIIDLCNKEAIPLCEKLEEERGTEITDESLAEKAEMKLKIVRRILYILDENNLTQYHRVRDKKSGWYQYYWEDNFNNLTNFLITRYTQVMEKLSAILEHEESNFFFICADPECNKKRFTMNEAMDTGFRCPICDGKNELKAEERENVVDVLKDIIIEIRSYL